uniref:protein-tyrosine-phosphatase n=1 Tax=Oryza nivara TaxID=4536 RepID=A0A0E0J6U2_ORYNI
MGISKVIGIAGTTLLVTSVGLWKIGLRIVAVPFLATSTIAYIIAVASHNSINIPWILGKNSKGRFPIWSSVLFGPFLILARVYATVKRHMRKKEAVYNMITEGVYLGGWPFMLKHLPPGDPSVIDCTCELPRSDFVPTNEYLCVPTWDTRAPTISQIEFAACWACEKRAKGKPVYVHCAFGHGRSACVVCAVLVALGIAENWKDAENIIREKRKIKMNAVHRKTLDDWTRAWCLLSGTRSPEGAEGTEAIMIGRSETAHPEEAALGGGGPRASDEVEHVGLGGGCPQAEELVVVGQGVVDDRPQVAVRQVRV